MGLLQQVTINTIYRVLFLVFQLLNTVLISRLIGPAGFGVYSLVIVNANLLLVFSSMGIPAGILYHASAKDLSLSRMGKIIWFSSLLQLILSLLIELIHHGVTGTYWIWPSPDRWAGIFGIVFFLAIVITEKYYALYNGFNRFPLYNLVVLIFSILLFLVLGFLIRSGAGTSTVSTVILTYIAVQLIQAVFLVVLFKQKKIGQLTIADTAGIHKKFFTYSVYAFLANALFFLVTRVDFWILNYFKGETELGIYALSSRIGQMFLVFPALFAGVILPSITAKKLSGEKLQSMFRILNSLNLISMFILALVASWLFPFMFGEEFRASVLPLVILLPGIFFLSAQTLLAAYFAGIGKPATNLYSTMISLAIVLILDFILIPVYGAIGASLASTIAYAAGCIYTYSMYIGKENYPWARLLMNNADKHDLKRLLSQALGEK
ncbi:MAG TPA: polysaccharide biosynthesis C-terminal domain-containing protein [Chitinophagaceae bacterium]|nr:polysaccharide biosynthesis C-terminal domain-containing protein [Chitinophagaceae bacterium]